MLAWSAVQETILLPYQCVSYKIKNAVIYEASREESHKVGLNRRMFWGIPCYNEKL